MIGLHIEILDILSLHSRLPVLLVCYGNGTEKNVLEYYVVLDGKVRFFQFRLWVSFSVILVKNILCTVKI